MKKVFTITSIVVLLSVLTSGYAHAGMWETVKSWVALVVSALLALAGGALGLIFRKISRTFKEAGEFMTVLGTALEDNRITRDELAHLLKEGREIFAVWR